MSLNTEQKRAVETVDGPVLIVAGAGSGKTKVITHRILNLMKKGVPASSILAITFTNKAAREMRDRVNSLISEDKDINRPISSSERPFMSTFHALGVHIIRENTEKLGLNKHFSIYDRADSKRAVKEAMEKGNIDPKKFDANMILNLISKAKGEGLNYVQYRDTAKEFIEEITSNIWEKYDAIMHREKSLDFDDLLLKTANLLASNNALREHYNNVWKYIHVDEYQDTNKVQYQITKYLTEKNRNICVVGDADQNIYTWRGATIENILKFEKDYPEATVITLEKNYRSTKTILSAANSVIEKNTLRKKKNLFTDNETGDKISLFVSYTEQDEARTIADTSKQLIENGVSTSEIAVLYRTNFQSRVIEEFCLRADLPYHVLGTKFFERKEVKDIISFLRLALNPQSAADLKRVINVPARGIGKTTLLKIVEGKADTLPAAMRIKLHTFYEMLRNIKEHATTNPVSKTISYIAEKTGILAALTKSEEDQEREENIKELIALSMRYDEMPHEEGIEKFLEDVSLLSDQDSNDEERDAVRLMTVHASKGLEFAYVFVVGLEEGLFPHERDEHLNEEDAEEERRLFYVAVTRAKKKLVLSYAQTRTIFGSSSVNIPSQFVFDIPEEYIEREFLDFTPRHKPLLHIEF